METYGIHPGYMPNPPHNTTLETATRRYWTPTRLRLAWHAQHHVYLAARELAKRHGLRAIADVGCGPGVKSARLLAPIASRFVGIDQPSVVEVARELHPGLAFEADDFEAPRARVEGGFDLLVCADVIEHLVDPDVLLRYLARLAAPGAFVVVSTPERDVVRGPDCRTSPKPEHIREWSAAEFRAYLESRGFRIVEHRLVPEERFRLDPAYLRGRVGMMLRGRRNRGTQLVVARPPGPPSYL